MSYHRHSNPFAALSITLLLLASMTAAGLYCAHFKVAEQPGLLRGYFTESPPPQQQRVIPQTLPIPEPDIALATVPILCLSTQFPDAVAATDEELAAVATLPLHIESSISPSTSEPRQTPQNRMTKENIYTPPVCQKAPQPDYPATMKSARRQGVVKVRIHISSNGIPTDVDIISSSHIAFAQAARHCILKQWRFIPAHQNGIPTPSIANISIHFKP